MVFFLKPYPETIKCILIFWSLTNTLVYFARQELQTLKSFIAKVASSIFLPYLALSLKF